ncbi:hypothetical protein [Streptomyces cylindrosporus]|uniref:Uncharacterized protein n=1 Tax=Streptomyces cylindrosporus TaxID=2927583 RepID=A0ABS9YEP6_9ACTN|nr:hypothetical protein [Streptomyces cylindrosporus]MCI3275005.1 hypothetical protein [Streptomyces cylindrosporus]
MTLDAIDAVNWSAIPNPTWHQYDDPEHVAHALRLLTLSTTANETGDAASLLAGGGFICSHAAMVFPAAYAATPILLDLVEHGRLPRIRNAAVGLLSDALGCYPTAGHNRVDTPYGTGIPLCCAMARHIRHRRSVLLAHGPSGKELLADAALHWRLAIEETERRSGTELIALAVLEGSPFSTPAEAETHTSPSTLAAATVRIEDLTADPTGAVAVHLSGTSLDAISAGSTLYPAECGRREH